MRRPFAAIALALLVMAGAACGGGGKSAADPIDPIDTKPVGGGPDAGPVAMVVTPGGPSGTSSPGSPLMALRQFTDELCLCPDKTCADGVMQRLQAFAQQYQGYQPTDAEKQEAEILVQRLVQCYQRLQNPTPPPSPQPPPTTP